jgi:hypothetical protein
VASKVNWSSSPAFRRLWRVWMALLMALVAFVTVGQAIVEGQGDQEDPVSGLAPCDLSAIVYDPFALDPLPSGCLMPPKGNEVQAELIAATVPSCDWTGVTYDPFALDHPPKGCTWTGTLGAQ